MGYFYYQDSLGNTSHVTDAVGNPLERYTYSAFGTPTVVSWTGSAWDELHPRNSSNFDIRHLFQGQLWTQETGLNDYRNRVELPTMGVFLQTDPAGFKGDAANLYRFVNNNAINRIDPLGLRADILAYGANDITGTWASGANPPPNAKWPKTFIYAGHGAQQDYNLGEVKDPRYKLNVMGSGPTIPTATVAELIIQHSGYKSSAQIFLAVCSAGAPTSSVARDLAIATGKPVIAPDKLLWFHQDGTYIVADPVKGKGPLRPDPDRMGHLVKWTPDGKSKIIHNYTDATKKTSDAINPAEWTPAATSSGPSAADVDKAHPAGGIPSLGAESVNHVNGKL
jgi:RHS repeat-associated protein